MADPDAICEITITAPDQEWLVDFTRQLVRDRLAASAHHTPVRSVYTWEGQLHDATEIRATIHTRDGQVQAVIDRTNSQHPYQVPCVIVTRITAANPAYRDWIIDVTS